VIADPKGLPANGGNGNGKKPKGEAIQTNTGAAEGGRDTPKAPQHARLWREAVLLALSKTQNVQAACKATKISTDSYYRLRRADPTFSTEADDAIRSCRTSLAAKARSRLEQILTLPLRALNVEAILRACGYALKDDATRDTKHTETKSSVTYVERITKEQAHEEVSAEQREFLANMQRLMAERRGVQMGSG
jgi:hypothetical protein